MILVTGGTGLVGSHLLAFLVKSDSKIRAIYRSQHKIESVRKVFTYYFDEIESYFSKIEWVQADLTDLPSLESAFEGIQLVYHAAGMISFHPKDYWKMRKINIDGTANIVNFCIAHEVQKLCFVSSVAAIGTAVHGGEVDEECEWSVENSNYGYAITKFGAEMEVWRGTQEGLDVVIVNPGIILGSGFWDQGSSRLFSKAYRGISFYTNGIKGYVAVEDVVRSMLELMHKDVTNERYIIVAEHISFKELLDAIASGFGKKKPSIRITKLSCLILWPILEFFSWLSGKEPLLTRHTAKSIHEDKLYSNRKIKQAIGIEFRSIQSTIDQTVQHYKIHLKN